MRAAVLAAFRAGMVLPAHPLALTADRRLDERRQRALTRYYLAAGAGGVAVGVHTTQFAIHRPEVGLLAPVLELASEEAAAYTGRSGRDVLLVAGVVGPVRKAVAEAELAAGLGYDAVLLSPYAGLDEGALVARARAVGRVLPVIGFYLQPAVGGRVLSRGFWTDLASLDSIVGIKVAPFNRYRTLDALAGVAASGRADQIALYTGNDDHILTDLVTPYRIAVDGCTVAMRFVGGLLGQWAMWTSRATDDLRDAHAAYRGDDVALRRLLVLDPAMTEANAAIFDAANDFHGCLPGIHEVLRRQGLLAGRWCLNPDEELSRGQLVEIDRIWNDHRELRDDEFVAAHLDEWLS